MSKRQATANKSPCLNHGIDSLELISIDKEIRETQEKLEMLIIKKETLYENAKKMQKDIYCSYIC